jgi:Ca-activated chloride channel homolog
MRFASPWALLALLAVPLIVYMRRGGRRRCAVRFSSLAEVQQAGRSLRQRFMWALPCLELVALVSLTIALARPQLGMRRISDRREGAAIEMLLDISSSMDISMQIGGKNGSRLEVAKSVFEEFVVGNGDDLPGRPNDLIGMVTFARYADTLCPLTLGHDALIGIMKKVSIEDRPNEDGTAIGDALALGAARLQTAEEVASRQSEQVDTDYLIKSKVIILLTDGESNCGKYLPRAGAAMASKWGIRVHVIAFGDRVETQTIDTPSGPRKAPGALGDDAKVLAALAGDTGGVFRTAHDGDSLRAVYAEINEMETTEIKSMSYLDYQDNFSPFALAAVLSLLGLSLLRSTVLRKIP